MKPIHLSLLLLATPLAAHDFWIEPSTYSPRRGEELTLTFKVGEHFRGESIALNPKLVKRFALVSDDERVFARHRRDPAAQLRFGEDGWVVYSSSGWFSTMSPRKFLSYVEEEGLQRNIDAKGVTDLERPIRDRFLRCAKTLVGSDPAFDSTRQVGLPFELVPLRDPRHAGVLEVQVSFEAKPLSEVLVVAMNREGVVLKQRSDAKGRVQLPLAAKGEWLIKAVHLVPSAVPHQADYDSYWASLLFQR